MKNPILLLDIDGVIMAPEYIHIPTKESIKELNRIIEETNCSIISISSWNIVQFQYDIDKATKYMKEWGIINPNIIGFTPGIAAECRAGYNGREEEIISWVESNKPKSWCALDDSIKEDTRMVRTCSAIGLQYNDANRVIHWLNS